MDTTINYILCITIDKVIITYILTIHTYMFIHFLTKAILYIDQNTLILSQYPPIRHVYDSHFKR